MIDRPPSSSDSLGLCTSPTEVTSPTELSPTSPSSSGPSTRKSTKPARPTLLHPPATIVSPPSPVDPKAEHRIAFSPPLPWSPPAGSSSSSLSYFSPPRSPDPGCSSPPSKQHLAGGEHEGNRPRAASDEVGPAPLAATHVSKSPIIMSPNRRDSLLAPDPEGVGSPSASPRKRDSLLPPESPDPGSGVSSFGPTPLSPRSPAPSSPGHYPRLGHRRESSTHRVRETVGKQSSTEDGERMINQYRIGKSLGKGAFAKVESAVDVGTGVEYAIKEFSASRLHTQALQEKHRQSTRGRMMRGRGTPRGGPGRSSPFPRGNPKRSKPNSGDSGSDASDNEMDTQEGGGGGRAGPWAGEKTMKEDPLGLIRREIAVMKKLDHPNAAQLITQIVHLYEAISVPSADALFLVLEYLPGGVLMSIQLGGDAPSEPPFALHQAREYFRQLVLGLEYLHSNGVIHRDIKPDNILLSKDREIVKLCDFGVSEMFVAQADDDRIKKSGGSPAFLSPESFTAHTHEVHGKAVDVWALGVTLYCILTGVLPFNTENPIQLFEMVQNEEAPIPQDWDADQVDVIKEMLRKDPSDRISLPALREHPWVTEHGENEMITTDDNLYHVGKLVEEPTQEELSRAIGTLRGVFTVIRAVQKMRRLQLSRRSLSSSSTASPPPFPRNFTLDAGDVDSAAVSLASGSMDSYVSEAQTDNTSNTEGGESRWEEVVGKGSKRVGSPTPVGGEDGDGDGSEVESLDLSRIRSRGDRVQKHRPALARYGSPGLKPAANHAKEDSADTDEARTRHLQELGAKGFEGLRISTNVRDGTSGSVDSKGSDATPRHRSPKTQPGSGSGNCDRNEKGDPPASRKGAQEVEVSESSVSAHADPAYGNRGQDVDIADSPMEVDGDHAGEAEITASPTDEMDGDAVVEISESPTDETHGDAGVEISESPTDEMDGDVEISESPVDEMDGDSPPMKEQPEWKQAQMIKGRKPDLKRLEAVKREADVELCESPTSA